MKSNKLIGMIQPKNLKDQKKMKYQNFMKLVVWVKLSNFKETDDGRYLIELKGIIRFQIMNEIKSNKKYRECEINFKNYYDDLNEKKTET